MVIDHRHFKITLTGITLEELRNSRVQMFWSARVEKSRGPLT
jgi:hypothetical protein